MTNTFRQPEAAHEILIDPDSINKITVTALESQQSIS